MDSFKFRSNLIFICSFFFSIVFLHYNSYDKLPIGRHAWQQADHYAVSLGFLENGFDFFKPQSFSLTHEFPPKKALIDPKGITSIDFPILHFTVALIMQILNSDSPIIFRFVTLFLSFVSLWFLFRLCTKRNGILIAGMLCGFIMFQPIYSFYQNGFHVSSSAFSIFLVGAIYMMKYFESKTSSFLYIGLSFLTLASLMRFTHIISLLSLLSLYAFLTFKSKRYNKNILKVLFCITVVLAYFVYNHSLKNTYGSIFLSHMRLSDTFSDFIQQNIRLVYTYLRGFTPFLHLFLIGIIILLFLRTKKKNENKFDNLKIWALFSSLGTCIFTILMSSDMSRHDYYVLDTWLPVTILVLLYMVNSFKQDKISKETKVVVVLMFLIGSFSVAFENQERKYDKYAPLSKAGLIIDDFYRSSDFLNLNVSNDDKVLIISRFGWNSPMIGWKRKCYRVAQNFPKHIPLALEKNYDIIVTHDATYKETVYGNYPEFESKVQFVSGNGLISLWKRKLKN